MCLSMSIGKKQRLLVMFCMTFGFMLTELIVGYCGDSMALVADSFHMLSDVIALVVAFVSILLSPRPWKQSTFGWARAEVLGALINAVFLIALCVTIVVEAFKRFIHPELISEPQWILCVGICGLVINLLGLFIFRGHAHSHHGAIETTHGHGHSHTRGCSEPAPSPIVPKRLAQTSAEVAIPIIARMSPDLLPPNTETVSTGMQRASSSEGLNHAQHVVTPESALQNQCSPRKVLNSSQMNMRGVFLHVLADAMGSIAVIISATVVWATEEAREHEGQEFWRSYIVYIDPVLSIIIVVLILTSTWPLLHQASMILLQAIPSHIQLDQLRRQLIEEIDDVVGIHEFHVWQLAGNRFVASVHLRCQEPAAQVSIMAQANQIFSRNGINSTTIQIEFDNHLEPQNLKSIEHNTECLMQYPMDAKN